MKNSDFEMQSTISSEINDIKAQKKYADAVRYYVSERKKELGRPLFAYVLTFGCQQNEADSERILGTAVSLGYEKTDEPEKADLMIYNTCAVREHAELRTLSRTGSMKALKKENPELITGLFGCMVTQAHRMQDVKMKYPYVDFVAGTNMLHRIPEILCDVIRTKRRRYYVTDDEPKIVEGVPVVRSSDIKSYVSIMYGCNNFCTYCVVPYVRGRERSREKNVIIGEVKELIENGCREITLLGQNVNSYGKGTDTDFPALLREISELPGDFILRFMTSHPKDASDELINVMASSEKTAKHFHLPMQSGSTEILRRMNRKYTAESYLSLAEKIKANIPGITLTTDIIVGFPGETEKDFEDTLEMVKKVGFDSVYPFIFSPRVGTPAAELDDSMTHAEKAERMSRLISLQTEISAQQNQKCVGKTYRCLCESKVCDEDGFYSARTSGNKLLYFKAKSDSPYGKFVNITVERSSAAKLYGKEI